MQTRLAVRRALVNAPERYLATNLPNGLVRVDDRLSGLVHVYRTERGKVYKVSGNGLSTGAFSAACRAFDQSA